MSKCYKVSKKTMNMGPKEGKTVYSVRPFSYGTLTTKDIADQIAMESTATPADVMAVLDRYTYYVKENLKKGYDIELFGFGKLYLRFLTGKAVENEKEANAKLVKSILPALSDKVFRGVVAGALVVYGDAEDIAVFQALKAHGELVFLCKLRDSAAVQLRSEQHGTRSEERR